MSKADKNVEIVIWNCAQSMQSSNLPVAGQKLKPFDKTRRSSTVSGMSKRFTILHSELRGILIILGPDHVEIKKSSLFQQAGPE